MLFLMRPSVTTKRLANLIFWQLRLAVRKVHREVSGEWGFLKDSLKHEIGHVMRPFTNVSDLANHEIAAMYTYMYVNVYRIEISS